jgi:hypothetical protein
LLLDGRDPVSYCTFNKKSYELPGETKNKLYGLKGMNEVVGIAADDVHMPKKFGHDNVVERMIDEGNIRSI